MPPTPVPYKARNGRVTWRVRVRAHGRYTSETFATEGAANGFVKTVEALGAEQAIALRQKRDTASDEYVPTLAEWLPQHIKALTGVTERTRKDYQRVAERSWLPKLGPIRLDDLTRDHIAAEVNRLDTSGLAAKSIANAHGLLSSVLGSAVRAGHIAANPAHRMRLPRSREEERDEPRFLTLNEYEALLEATPEHWRPLVALLFGSGLRWSEATALLVGDVAGPPLPTVHVIKAWKTTPGQPRHVGPPKSRKSRRTALLSVQAHDLLELRRPKDARLFTGPHGGAVWHGAFRDRVWVPATRAAGLASPDGPYDGPRIHDARHTHASWLISNGATLEMVQDQLGHESILTTRKIYGHLLPETQNRLAAALTAAMTAPPQIES